MRRQSTPNSKTFVKKICGLDALGNNFRRRTAQYGAAEKRTIDLHYCAPCFGFSSLLVYSLFFCVCVCMNVVGLPLPTVEYS